MYSYKAINKKPFFFFVIALFILALRAPHVFVEPQFYIEDGAVWFQDAFNARFSVATLLYVYQGGLHLLMRIPALFTGLLPLGAVPFFFSYISALIACMPVAYIWSTRFCKIVPNTLAKLMLTIAYCLLPFTNEIHGTLTNAQWYMALTIFILVVIDESQSRLVRYLEHMLFLVASLTGPFAIFLLPISIIYYFRNRSRNRKVNVLILAIGACIQTVALFVLSGETRNGPPITFSPVDLFNIIGGQIVGAGIGGTNSQELLTSRPWITPIITVLAAQLILFVLFRAKFELKLFIVFSSMIVLAALASPPESRSDIINSTNWWQTLASTGYGGRYYFLAHLALYASLIWLVFSRVNLVLRVFACMLLLTSFFTGIPSDFKYTPRPDRQLERYVPQVENTKKTGQPVILPADPPGWDIHLN